MRGRFTKRCHREVAPSIMGSVRWWGRDARGRFVGGGRCNLIVDSAKTFLGDLVRGATGSTKLVAMAVGSGSIAPVASNTALGNELARVALPADGTSTSTEKNLRSGTIVTLRETFTGITGTVNEVGLFGDIAVPPGAANSGRMFNRALIGPITLVSTATLTVESQLTFN